MKILGAAVAIGLAVGCGDAALHEEAASVGGSGGDAPVTTGTAGSGGSGASGGGGEGGASCLPGAPCSKVGWAKRFGDAKRQTAHAVAFDPAGDVVLTGTFAGSLDFGAGALTTTGDATVFVAKLAGADGAPIWARQFGESGFATGIAVDPSGNVLVAGTSSKPIDFGGGPICSDGFNQTFLAKLDGAGRHVFSRCFGDPAGSTGNRAFVATDTAGNAVLVGTDYDAIDFGTGPLPLGDGAAFVAKFDAAGNTLWARAFGGDGGMGWGVSTDASNAVFMSGTFRDEVRFGDATLGATTRSGAFVLKLSQDGELAWARGILAAAEQQAGVSSIASSSDGTAAVPSSGFVAIDFGDGQVENHAGLVARFDGSGALGWTRSIEAAVAAGSTVADPAGRLFVNTVTNPDPAHGSYFGLAALDASGATIYSRMLGPGAGGGLAIHGDRLALAGFVSAPIDLGTGVLRGSGGDDDDAIVAVWGL